jgi:hypothetical protein
MRMGVRSVSQLRHPPDNTSVGRVTSRRRLAPVINNAAGRSRLNAAIAEGGRSGRFDARCTGSGASACVAQVSFSRH